MRVLATMSSLSWAPRLPTTQHGAWSTSSSPETKTMTSTTTATPSCPSHTWNVTAPIPSTPGSTGRRAAPLSSKNYFPTITTCVPARAR